MGTTSDKLTYLNTTKDKLKNTINYTGAGIDNNTTFREYDKKLYDGLANSLKYNENTIFNNMPKVTTTGTSLTMNDTTESLIKVELNPTELQQSNVILPSGYTQVDYIESSGTQYIETNYKATGTETVEVDCSLAKSDDQQCIFGANGFGGASSQLRLYTGQNGDVDKLQYAYGSSSAVIGWSTSIANLDTTIRTLYKFGNGSFYINNLSYTTYNVENFNSSIAQNCTIFNVRKADGTLSNLYSTMKLYRLKITDNNVVVRDFIPCYRNSDNEVGLYDIANNVFYTNAGTGAFTKSSNSVLPNPDYQQEIHTISGDNEIIVRNKNLFDNIVIGEAWNGTSNSARALIYAKVEPNTNYTISFDSISNVDSLNYFEKENISDTTLVYGTQLITDTTTKETKASTHYIGIQINKTDVTLNDVLGIKLQLEKGNSNSSYVPHEEQTHKISLVSKNLFNTLNYTSSDSGVTANIIDNNNVIVTYNSNSSTYMKSNFIINNLKQNTNYTFKAKLTCSNPSANKGWIKITDASVNTTLGNIRYLSEDLLSFNTRNYTSILVSLYAVGEDTLAYNSAYWQNIQIQEGNGVDAYEPYTPEKQIEYCKIGNYEDKFIKPSGKNLFDKNTNRHIMSYLTTNDTWEVASASACFRMDALPNTTYTVSVNNPDLSVFRVAWATTENLPVIGEIVYLGGQIRHTDSTPITITTGNDAKSLIIQLGYNSFESTVDTLQVEYGSSATEYEPFNDGKWYLKKNIGKITFNGTESTSSFETNSALNTTNYNCFFYLNDLIPKVPNDNTVFTMSNKFKGTPSNQRTSDMLNCWINHLGTSRLGFHIYNTITSVSDLITWFSNNNCTFYYPLATPTYTLLNNTLQTQLDNLYYKLAQSYKDQTNISQTNNDLPFSINASAIKKYE